MKIEGAHDIPAPRQKVWEAFLDPERLRQAIPGCEKLEALGYDDYRDPAPGATDVVVRVAACALNHVDMLLLDGRFPPPEGLPHVNGCEVTGVVEATGAEVKGRTRGQRVIIFPGFSCGQCEYCLRGERTVCTRYGYLGAHKDGCYAGPVKAPAP